MRITDLLKIESIELHGQVKTKEEAIDRMVELMVKSEISVTNRRINRACSAGKRKGPQGSAAELPFPMPRIAV